MEKDSILSKSESREATETRYIRIYTGKTFDEAPLVTSLTYSFLFMIMFGDYIHI
jgi:hypothetical protein